MAIHLRYRADRKRWGFAGYHRGKRYAKFAWPEWEDADKAFHRLMVELENGSIKNTKTEVYCFSAVAGSYIDDSSFRGRSTWRTDALTWNFQKWVIPFFGDATPITEVNCLKIEKFLDSHIQRGVKNSTIWHYITDLRAMFNWAIKKTLRARAGVEEETDYGVTTNPVNLADLSLIKNRRVVKMGLDPKLVDKAAEVLEGQDRIYFNCLRWTGLRMDEANRLQWHHLDLDRALMMVPGTKTEDSASVLPLCPALSKVLQALQGVSGGCPWVFPGQSGQSQGKKVYGRTRMFEKIYRKTGIKLTPKDLRDYFASEVSSKVQDPNVIMRLLRHTNLNTTTKYLRVVEDRMAEAVKGLGESSNPKLSSP